MRELKVVSVEQRAGDVFEIFLERKDLQFKVGNCIPIYGEDNRTSRPFSIASGVNDELLSFIIKKVGLVSNYICTREKGDTLKLANPFGWFEPSTSSKEVFVSTGTGISPFMCALRSGEKYPLEFILGAREDEFSHYYNFIRERTKLVRCLTRVDSGEIKGRVTKYLQSTTLKEDTEVKFLLCGLDSMISDCTDILLFDGVSDERIEFECFFNNMGS